MATVKLTDRAIATAKAKPGQRVELWDTDVKGLGLRVSATGKVWVFRYRTLDGRQPRLILGDYPGLLLTDARDAATGHRRTVREGGDPAGEKRRRREAARTQRVRTVADLAAAYFLASGSGDYRPRKKVKRASTLTMEKGLWARHLKGEVGHEPVEALDRSAVRMALRNIKAKAPIQANRCHGLLRRMFNFAIWDERLSVNPVVGIDPPAEERPRERVLTDAELKALWAGLSNPEGLSYVEGDETVRAYVGKPVALALQLSLLTLQRRGEVAGMRRDELRLDEGLWLIGSVRTKADAAHAVPLSPAAVALIRAALALHPEPKCDAEPSPFVFPSPRGPDRPIGANALTRALIVVYRAVGITGASLHDLRRTGATVMASERLGVSPFIVSRVLGHRGDTGGGAAVTLRHYNLHDYAGEKRAALNAWAALLAEIAEGVKRPDNVTVLRAQAPA